MGSASSAPHLRVIAMGGTIAFGNGPLGAVPTLQGSDLVRLAGAGTARVDVVDLANISSIGLLDQHLIELAQLVRASARDGYSGVVITHGTDTLEETAYFLALTCGDLEISIVITGAMRHNGTIAADGAENLRTALLVAADPAAASVGPLVVMHDEIHAARFATKLQSTRLGAFGSPAAGPVGQIVEKRVALWFAPLYRDAIAPVDASELPRVEIASVSVGMAPYALERILGTGPAGVVVEGMGGGHLPPQLLETLDAGIAQGIPIVMASRCAAAATLEDTYSVEGGEIDLRRRGTIMAGAISAPKARLRLAVALAVGMPAENAFPVV